MPALMGNWKVKKLISGFGIAALLTGLVCGPGTPDLSETNACLGAHNNTNTLNLFYLDYLCETDVENEDDYIKIKSLAVSARNYDSFYKYGLKKRVFTLNSSLALLSSIRLIA